MSFNSNRSRRSGNNNQRSNSAKPGKLNKPRVERFSRTGDSSPARAGKDLSQEKRSYGKGSSFDKKQHPGTGASRSFGKRSFERSGSQNPRFEKKTEERLEGPDSRPQRFDRKTDGSRVEKKSFSQDRNFSRDPKRGNYKPREESFKREESKSHSGYKKRGRNEKDSNAKRGRSSGTAALVETEIRLNRYIANAGVCSRRKADELIEAGVITVNGEVITSLGTKVDPTKDDVRYNGERLKREKTVYVLLNKPKDYITTTDDPQERKTVMHLVEKSAQERIYPVGRLDRNTTGLLLMTNDGALAEKLSHPRNNITKIYHVELNKAFTQGDLNKLRFGIELEDGTIKPDDVNYVQGASKREVGIQIHSGKNRIVRRIFESLGYKVIKLDRVVYGNLTKKDLPRGRWRYLEEREVIQLKHLM